MAGVGFGGGAIGSAANSQVSSRGGTTPGYGFGYGAVYNPTINSTDPAVAAAARQSGAVGAATNAGAVDAAYRKAALGDLYPSLMSLFSQYQSGTGTTGVPTVPHPDNTANAQAEQDARNAAFARAKDTAGNIARAAIDSLHGEASARGIDVAGGSNPLMLRGEADVIGATGNQLGEVARTQAENDAARAASISDRNYAGDITMRGQDLTAQAEAARLRAQQMQSLLSMFSSALY